MLHVNGDTCIHVIKSEFIIIPKEFVLQFTKHMLNLEVLNKVNFGLILHIHRIFFFF